MIGNDIVDLKYTERNTNWKRSRFLYKVFSKKELFYISNAEDQDQMVWRLWSMKEAAYKAYVRTFEFRFFNPKRIECRLLSSTTGNVKIENENYNTISRVCNQFIYSEAFQGEDQIKHSSVHKFPFIESHEDQRNNLYQKLIEYVSGVKNMNGDKFKLVKSKIGIPFLIDGSTNLSIQFSLTHCGRFGAFSVLDL